MLPARSTHDGVNQPGTRDGEQDGAEDHVHAEVALRADECEHALELLNVRPHRLGRRVHLPRGGGVVR